MRRALIALAAGALLRSASGLLLTSGSPCEQYCGNVLTNTTGADMVCNESDYYSQSAGIVFEACIKCQLTSGYAKGSESDLGDMLYNLRYAMSWCVFGDPGNTAIGTNPCITSTACGPLKNAFEYQDFSHDVGAFDYCSANWSDFQMPKCQACLTAANENYINNFVTILDAACMQRPVNGSTVSVSSQPFTSTPITITTPSPVPTYVVPADTGPLSLGAKVGIAIGALALLLFIAGVAIVCNGKRRRRAFLRDLEKRHAEQGWPHPGGPGFGGGQSRGTDGDMFETPVSQRPLVRPGWEESPVSAVPTEHTDRTLPRYFSPYSSQYNSPVSAIEGPSMMNWPTQQQLAQGFVPDQHNQQAFSPYADQSPQQQMWPSSQQEKLAQVHHEQQLQQSRENEIQIGLALGGDEASLRSKNSNPHFNQAAEGHDGHEYTQYGYPVDKKGKDQVYGGSGEEYELREVDRHNGSVPPMPVLPQAPVLHHPGYGRAGNRSRPGSQEEQQHQYGQYSEDDVRRGHVI